MTLLSASEDFQYRTLASLGSALEQLAYVMGLRKEDRQYRHWGMERTYGAEAADAAIAEVHSQIWLRVLRTSIPELLREVQEMDRATRLEVMRGLKDYRKMSYPAELSGGTIRHFNSVLLALESLSRSSDATHQVA
jgi:hypothetical protein